jgi:hypothetical protein
LNGHAHIAAPAAKVEDKGLDYMQFMRCIILGSNHNQRFVYNMDQTPVYFSMNAKRMLELIGKGDPHLHVDGRHKANDCGGQDCSGWYHMLLPLMLDFKMLKANQKGASQRQSSKRTPQPTFTAAWMRW